MTPTDIMRHFGLSRAEADELLRLYRFGRIMVNSLMTKEKPHPGSHKYETATMAVPDMMAVMRLREAGMVHHGMHGHATTISLTDDTIVALQHLEQATNDRMD